jgi:cellulose biosynthesis protein BcsQ
VQSIAIYSRKGGAGKSALTVLLAEMLSCFPYGQRVLVVDLDPQQSSSTALLGDAPLRAAVSGGQSLTALLRARRKKLLSKEQTQQYLAVRPAAGKGGAAHLQTIHLLSPDPEDWDAFDEQLRAEKPKRSRKPDAPSPYALLREALEPLEDEFDIVLIDFPGHDSGPIVRCGLFAADRWLFPVNPDRMGARDLDGSRQLIRRVYLGQRRRIKSLGTLLTMCQQGRNREYQRAKKVLTALAEKKYIPPLFSTRAELGFWTEVKTALDDLVESTTLHKKMGGREKPLLPALEALTEETLERLRLPFAKAQRIEAERPVNATATRNW